MKELIKDYYSGFDGEPEIKFKIRNKIILRLWIGYFDKIMKQIQPKNGKWDGLVLYYHLDKGWYEESPWRIPDLIKSIKKFLEIDKTQLSEKENMILEDIIYLLKATYAQNDDVMIIYE